MKEKSFDCVEMKRKIQQEILKDIEGMTMEEQIRYTEKRISSDPILAPLWARRKGTRETETAG